MTLVRELIEAIQDREMREKTRRISMGDSYLEYEFSSEMESKEFGLLSEDGDVLPSLQSLGVPSYTYFSFVYVPEKERRKGLGSKLIDKFLDQVEGPVYIKLVDSDVTQGTVLAPYLESLGFEVLSRSLGEVSLLRL